MSSLVTIVLVVSLPFVAILFGRPVLRRLAVRNATRRPRETLLVLLGSLLGTAIITGSFIVGDTLDASIRQSAFTQLGPVDEVVEVEDGDALPALSASLAGLPEDQVDGVLPVVGVQAAVATPDQTRAEPSAQLWEVDFADALAFGGDEAATGIEGPTPTGEAAVITEDLAGTLMVGPGDQVEVFAYGAERTFTIDRVLDRRGIAGLRVALQSSESPNLFLPPGTIESLAQASVEGAVPPDAYVVVSNEGGVLDGAERSDAVEGEIVTLAGLSGVASSVFPAKAELLAEAEAAGEEFTTLFSAIGFFSVLAGVLLLVNIFVALAQERKTELGMLRAVGLRRGGLVASFSLEGWLYALASALLGAVVGIGVGRVIVLVASGIFASGDDSLELGFSATPSSIVAGFGIGFLISLATVMAASLGIARLNVIRAIRDLPEPTADRRQRLVGLVLGGLAFVVGALLSVSGITGEEPFTALAGPGIVGVGLVALLARLRPRRPVVSTVSIAVLAWGILAFDLFPDVFAEVDIPLFVVQGVLLVGAAVALVSQNQDFIGAVLRRIGGGSRSMALRLGLAYPLARRFRTGMILSMYSLVVFTLTFITVLSSLFSSQIDDFTEDVSGGYDFALSSNPSNPVPPDEVRATDGVDAVAELAVVGAQFKAEPLTDGFTGWGVAGFDAGYFSRGRSLAERDPAYATDEEAFAATVADPTRIIVSEFFLQSDGGGPPAPALEPGAAVSMRNPTTGDTRALTVSGVIESGFGNDLAFVSRPGLVELFGDEVTVTELQVATSSEGEAEGLVDELNGRYLANGGEAETFRSIVSENLSEQTQFFRLMQGYLALGLVVGVAGLGVVAVRAVRERRRQVGVLRSLGFESSAVRRAFLTESAFVALEGILIGVVLALITAWRLVGTDAFGEDVPFTVPWGQLAILVLATFVASLIATATPAQQASRIKPAVALRLSD